MRVAYSVTFAHRCEMFPVMIANSMSGVAYNAAHNNHLG